MATNLDLAKKVASNVELDAITLRYAKVETGCEPEDLPEEVSVDIQYRSQIEHRKHRNNPELPMLAVSVDFRFLVEPKEEQNAEILKLEAGYLLTYFLNPGAAVEDICFKHFAEANGPYNAWPYWRELVQSVTSRVGMPGFIVPVFRPSAVEIHSTEDSP